MEQPIEQQTIPDKESSENQQKNKPVKKFICGGVAATVWENVSVIDNKQETYYTINLERRYTKDNGVTWESTNSYGVKDLHGVITVSQKAYEFVKLKRISPNEV